MAMLRFGHAAVVKPFIGLDEWVSKTNSNKDPGRVKVAKSVVSKYNPDEWLLSHTTIIASVDTEQADKKDPKSNYLIKPEYSQFVNNNGDAWERELLKGCYKTFLGADNFLEHCQLPALSKGKVIDVALREVVIGKDDAGKDLTTLYVDILIATNRKHAELVAQIESGEYNAVSMGCFLPGTEITMEDGTKRKIENVRPGSFIITHTGKKGRVKNLQVRKKDEEIYKIKSEGNPNPVFVTEEHPFFAFRNKRLCACGCGKEINSKIKNGIKKFKVPNYAVGHFARVCNPNGGVLKEGDKPITENFQLEWIPAKDLLIGSYLSYPTGSPEEENSDISIEEARLLGYFVAEGSYVKEIKYDGEDNDYAVKCRICGLLYNHIAQHLRVHDLNSKKYRELYPDAPIKAKNNFSLLKPKSRFDEIPVGLTRSYKITGLEFSLGEHEYNTVNKEIISLAKKVWPGCTILRYKKSVKIIDERAAEFMFDNVGEYSDSKVLNERVLYWPVDKLKHLIATWFIGDYACTVSKQLYEQFKLILARCGVRYNAFVTKSRPYITFSKGKQYKGIKKQSYLLQINTLGMEVLKHYLKYAFNFKNNKLTKVYHKARTYADYKPYILRKITEIEKIHYTGLVYNLEVENDNSYIANDVAVHNCLIAFSVCSHCGNVAKDETEACPHVKYYKGNYFYDDNGVKRRIAELCGHKDDTSSCKFIDASWVKQPAFTGAVLRNIVKQDDTPPQGKMLEQIEQALKSPSYERQENHFVRAASDNKKYLMTAKEKLGTVLIEADEVFNKKGKIGLNSYLNKNLKEILAQEPEEKPEETKEEPENTKEEPVKDVGFPETPVDTPTEIPEETPEGTPEVPKPDVSTTPVEQVKDEIKKTILDRVKQELLTEQQDVRDRPLETETFQNESLVRSFKRFSSVVRNNKKLAKNEKLLKGVNYLGSLKKWSDFKKYGYNRNDVLGLIHLYDMVENNKPLSKEAVDALSKVRLGSNWKDFFTEYLVERGTKNPDEYDKISKWARILKNFDNY